MNFFPSDLGISLPVAKVIFHPIKNLYRMVVVTHFRVDPYVGLFGALLLTILGRGGTAGVEPGHGQPSHQAPLGEGPSLLGGATPDGPIGWRAVPGSNTKGRRVVRVGGLGATPPPTAMG